MTEKTIHDHIDTIIEHPTLDRFLDRHPRTMKYPEDYKALVEVLRRDRARFIQAESEKKVKKESSND